MGMHNIFPLSLVPKPIRNMQNMFALSNKKSNHVSSKRFKPKINGTLWRQLNSKEVTERPTSHKRIYGGKSNGFSRLVTFDNKKRNQTNGPSHPHPHMRQTPKNNQIAQPLKQNNLRQSDIALFGGFDADDDWKPKKVATSNNPVLQTTNKQPFNIDDTIRRQEHLNSVINAYKNNSLTTNRMENYPKLKSTTGKNFYNVNMKRDFHQRIDDADDASWRIRNTDNENVFNHRYDRLGIRLSQKG